MLSCMSQQCKNTQAVGRELAKSHVLCLKERWEGGLQDELWESLETCRRTGHHCPALIAFGRTIEYR